jgi:hypothetical protein
MNCHPLPSNDEIAQAIKQLKSMGFYRGDFFNESPNSVKIAFAWLDAQNTVKHGCGLFATKHLIEAWGGRYVSTSDTITAAFLHPRISGSYPSFNLSKRLIFPCYARLNGIAEAFTQGYHPHRLNWDYKIIECEPYKERGAYEKPY